MFKRTVEDNDLEVIPLVYLVDDDDDYRNEIIISLSRFGLKVEGFSHAAAFYKAYAVKTPDVVILDVSMDGEDGISICSYLRSSQSVGIIMVSARGAVDERIVGLKAGADIYLVKPVDVRELAAAIFALNKRLSTLNQSETMHATQWVLLENDWILSDGKGKRLKLTASEKEIIKCLLLNEGKTVSREMLVQALGKDIYEFNYGHLDTIISRLRRRAKKIEMDIPLHAVRGEGFLFANSE